MNRQTMKSITHTRHLLWDKDFGTYLPNGDILEIEPIKALKRKGKKPTNLFLKGPIRGTGLSELLLFQEKR
jgi:hypothetical protein